MSTPDHERRMTEVEPAHGIMAVSFLLADIVRFLVELFAYCFALVPAGMLFVWFWGLGTKVWHVLAFPAAFVGLVAGFYVAIFILRILFLRRIQEGEYSLKSRRALHWILADSLMHLFERSPLRGFVKEFAFQRYLFYRFMGARVDRTFIIGWDAKIVDPWLVEIGRNVLIGGFVVISGHAVEGGVVTLRKVRIHDRATIGMRAILMPGVTVGEGAIVGAGALVTKGTRIPAGEIWAGIPAHKIGEVHREDASPSVP